MAEHKDWNKAAEIKMERDRAFRMEETVKRAVRIAGQYKASYEESKAENEALKKELATMSKKAERVEKALSNVDKVDIPNFLATLDNNIHFRIRNLIRKALHPDKHSGVDKDVKEALTQVFIIIEGQLK